MTKNINIKSLSRYLAVQAIFNQSFGFNEDEIEKQFTSISDFKFNVDLDCEISKKKFDKIFFKKIYQNVFKKNDVIYSLISSNLDSAWPINRLPRILQAILKVAISEILTYPKTPLGIIVTEYLDLAKSFNMEKENSFINAILDKIYNTIKNG